MRKPPHLSALTVALLLAACGGGGGGGAPSPAPAPSPTPSPPDPSPAPGTPAAAETALARPISPTVLCGNGSRKRQSSVSSDSFRSVAVSLGINHNHFVDAQVWSLEPGSEESVMRTGAVVVTSIDDDCWPELLFTTGATATGQLVLYANAGGRGADGYERGFVPLPLLSVTAASYPVAGLGVADLDGDYRLDLALGNLLGGPIETWRQADAGGFELLQSIASSRSTLGFAFGDYSGDGWLDVFAAHWDLVPPASDAPALLRNLGAGTTAQRAGSLIAADAESGTSSASVSQDSNLAPAFSDIDSDGDADLLIAADAGSSALLVNSGSPDPALTAVSPPLSDENAAGQALRDFDNDGHWDWFVASVYGPDDGRDWSWGTEGNRLYWGDGVTPWLTDADPGAGVADAAWPWGVCAEDFDNDGFADIFVESGFGYTPSGALDASLVDMQFTPARLFINQGGRAFVESAAAWGLSAATNGRGVACLDYDRDGDIDIAVAQNSGAAIVYENQASGADGNAFVSLRLLGPEPNTYSVGAVVTVAAGGASQMRAVGANSNYMGQDSTELHFGLGAAAVIDSISVRWPDGTTETFEAIPANRFLTLLDPRLVRYADPSRMDRIDQAIGAALDYVSVPSRVTDDVILGLTWMERMHGISLPYSPVSEFLARESRYLNDLDPDNDLLASQLYSWRGSFDAGHQLSQSERADLQDFDRISFAGVYCHQYPLTDEDISLLRGYVAGGGYDTTHALLALLWAIDNDCPMPPTYDNRVLSDVVRDVVAIADAGGSVSITDLRVEAMALLAASGRHDLVEPAWVDQLLDAQLENGAWKGDPNDSEALPHTTGIALWLLLMLAEDVEGLTGFVAQSWDQY